MRGLDVPKYIPLYPSHQKEDKILLLKASLLWTHLEQKYFLIFYLVIFNI